MFWGDDGLFLERGQKYSADEKEGDQILPFLVERDIDPGKKKREEIGNLIRKMSAKRA